MVDLGSDGVTLLNVIGDRAVTRLLAVQVDGRGCRFSPADDYLLCDELTSGDRTVIRLSDGYLDQLHHDPTHVAVAWLSATELPSPGRSRP